VKIQGAAFIVEAESGVRGWTDEWTERRASQIGGRLPSPVSPTEGEAWETAKLYIEHNAPMRTPPHDRVGETPIIYVMSTYARFHNRPFPGKS
jgi:hypothetical protein